MAPVPMEDLVIGRYYYIRSKRDINEAPWGEGGKAPFFYTGEDFRLGSEVGPELVAFDAQWNFFKVEDGEPMIPLNIRHEGRMFVPEGTNSVLLSEIKEGDEIVNWGESKYGRFYTAANYAGLPSPKISPSSRLPIVNPRRYTVSQNPKNAVEAFATTNTNLFKGGKKSRRRRRNRKTRKH
jgi:hypothetical protein